MEFRKHISDMNSKEERLLRDKLNNNTYKATIHTVRRKSQRVITDNEIEICLKDYKIIEYHRVGEQNRVLIRGQKNECGQNVCLVLNIDNGSIVTAYLNDIGDTHTGINMQNYISYIDITGLLKNAYINDKNIIQ